VAPTLAAYYNSALTSPVDADITAAAPIINGTSKSKNPPLPLLQLLPNRVLSIGNRGDSFINLDASWVGKGGDQESSNNNPVVNDCKSGPYDLVCHGNVLFDPMALQWATNMIVRQQLPTDQAGGWWSGNNGGVSVTPNQDNSDTLAFSAHAYTTHRLETIDQVKFTGQWQEGSNRSWETVCPDAHQTADGDFGCSARVTLPTGFTGPTARLKVGFDVYMNNQPPRQSPNGNQILLFSMQAPAPPPTPIPPATATPIPPTNLPAPAPLVMTISANPSTVTVGQANQLCITVSEAASVVLTYTYNGPSTPMGTETVAAGMTCLPSQPLNTPGAVVITAVGTPTAGGASVSSQATVTVVSPALIVPGGLWVSPADGSTTTGQVQFEAEAYPTNPGDPAIAYVNFTMGWPVNNPTWTTACTANSPIGQAPDGHALYGCTVDLSTLTPGPPPGPVLISFDVYDSQYVQGQPGHGNLAPNGEHTITYQPAPPPGPTEQLTVNPTSGLAGSTVCLTWIDDNDSPGGSGTISFDGQQIGSYQAASTTENWSGCLATPADAQPGDHTIHLAEGSDNSGGSTTFTVTGGSNGTLLGPVDLNAYCQFLGDSGVVLNGTTAYDWYCVTGNGAQVGINMNGACVWQYSRTDAIARVGAVSDPNSWRCYAP